MRNDLNLRIRHFSPILSLAIFLQGCSPNSYVAGHPKHPRQYFCYSLFTLFVLLSMNSIQVCDSHWRALLRDWGLSWVSQYYCLTAGPRQAKKCLRASARCDDVHHPAHAQGLLQTFALLWCVLLYPMFLAADSIREVLSGLSLSAHAQKAHFYLAQLVFIRVVLLMCFTVLLWSV